MAAPVFYLHLANDGGLFAVDGEGGSEAWITEADLLALLDAWRDTNGTILISSDCELDELPPIAAKVLDRIRAARVTLALSSEIHPHARRSGGATTLMMAAYSGEQRLLEDLVRRRADVHARDTDGQTALMYAANGGHEKAVDLLLEAGSGVDDEEHTGSTALMFAAQHGHFAAVRKLLQAGAKVNTRGKHGLTAADLAQQNGQTRVLALLLAREPSSAQ